jgi:sugar/nucleoside kinase (ribokinase family)
MFRRAEYVPPEHASVRVLRGKGEGRLQVKVLGFGDNVIDRFLDRGLDYPGGNCVNFAVFASQLAMTAGYLGVFGSDEYGEFMRSELDGMGIDVSQSVVRNGESGIAQVEVVEGERVFRGGNGGGITTREPIILGKNQLAYISGFDLIHSSVYSASETELPKLRSLEILVSYDLSSEAHFRSDAYLDVVAPNVDLALLSCSDISESETESALVRVVRHGAEMALGTRGGDGAILFDGQDLHYADAIPLVPSSAVADTMGCGDAFLAMFTTTLLRSGWRKHGRASQEAIAEGLSSGAAFAAEQCFVDGAFGHSRPFRDTGAAVPTSW